MGETTLTKADSNALIKMPDDKWFTSDDLPYVIRSPRYRCDRLVEKGQLEWRVTGEYPHLQSEYRKVKSK